MKRDDVALEMREQYRRHVLGKTLILLGSLLLLLVLVIWSVSIGSADLTFGDVVRALLSRFSSRITVPEFNYDIVWSSRLPRVLMAVISGMGLSISGVQMQGITGNPLVSPFTLGVSSAAALGASIAILFGTPLFAGAGETYMVILTAFLFCMGNTILVFLLSKIKNSSAVTLVLAGTALNYFYSAITSVLHYFASEEDLKAMVHWTFGTFTGTDWSEVTIVAVVLLVCMPLCLKEAWSLNAITAGGDEVARSLGVNAGRVRIVSVVLSSLMTATVVSFTGVIGFVCLVAPHLARYMIGGDHRFLLPLAGVFGAILTVVSDIVGRVILEPIILPVSIVISFVGVPLFLYMVLTNKKDFWAR